MKKQSANSLSFFFLLWMISTGVWCAGLCIQPLTRKGFNPCEEARVASKNATTFAASEAYLSALRKINSAARDGKEHGVVFGKDANGKIVTSGISSGSFNAATLPDIHFRFADMHNHPNNAPPHSGDIYGFMRLAIETRGYMRFIVTANHTVFCLIPIDKNKAANFLNAYPPRPGIKDSITGIQYQPTFPEQIIDEISEMKSWGATEESAIAFILEKYQTGVAILKQNPQGVFKRLNTREYVTVNGGKLYKAYNCP
ncbi:MAG: hypothetical protein QM727_13765 [Niabella sp.]